MKKKFGIKRILILAMVLALIIGAAISIFAGVTEGSLYEYGITSGNGNTSGGTFSVNNDKAYILAVYTGDLDGNSCYKIAVTYRTPSKVSTNIDGKKSGDYVEITQVLNVKEGRIDNTLTADAAYNNELFRNGTRYNTFIRLWNNNSGTTTNPERDGRYVNNILSYHRLDSDYIKYVYNLTGESNTQKLSDYYGDTQISAVDNLFPSYSTEYIRFQPEYEVSEIVKVEFIMKSVGVSTWRLIGWDIYEYTEWKREQGKASDYAGPTVSLDNSSFNAYVGPQMTNYAYLSDRLALIMKASNGSALNCIATGTYDTNRLVGVSNNIGIATFVSSLASSYNSYLTNPQNEKYGFINYTYGMTNKHSEYSSSSTTLNFEIEFEDEYGAGIETYNTDIDDNVLNVTSESLSNEQRVFNETLYATIAYVNDKGFTEEVTVPVVTNALLEATLLPDEANTASDGDLFNQIINNRVTLFAQQGQYLTFHVEFPNYKSLKSVLLKYNNTVDPSDSITIKQLTVYNDTCSSTRFGYYGSDGSSSLSRVVPDSCTALYRNSEEDYDIYLDDATNYYKYDLVDASSTRKITDDYSDYYLVTLKTANVVLAGTNDNVYIQLEYVSSLGGEKVTDEYNISDSCKAFYGYNAAVYSNAPGSNNLNEYDFEQKIALRDGSVKTYVCHDGSYLYGMQSGETIQFLVKANDLTRFTGATFRIVPEVENAAIDEWQLDSITIQSIESVGKRRVMHIDGGKKIGDLIVYNIFSRAVTGDILINRTGINLFIQNTSIQEIRFEDGEISGDTEESRDYKDYYYSMSYEIASSDLHFDTVSKSYEVKVHVSGTKDSLTDDNAGSNNLFYFQLIFKNGKSAYVLANQQLSADGFRSGETETFVIKTNEDYGELSSISIIPDDVTEDSTKLDKLCIDYIEVIKQNGNGINKKYQINNVGWISPEFHDVSTDDVWNSGRAVRDMASVFPVVSSSYMLTLEFAISYDKYGTLEYTTTDNNGDIHVETKVTPQFEGQLKADITYVDSNGDVQIDRDVNLIEYMNTYDSLSAITDADNNTLSNTKWMLRENTTDRFYYTVEDISMLKSITIKGNPLYTTKLNVSSLSVSIVTSEGRRYINANNEFQHIYSKDSVLLVDKIVNRTLPEYFYFAANQQTSYTFTFDETQGTIPSFDEDTNLSTVVSRVPESINDTLNVFIYMKAGSKSPSQAGQTLTSSIYYSSSTTGKTYMNQIVNYDETEQDGRICLSVSGLNATGMTNLTNFVIKANSTYTTGKIDYAIIQQIRNNTIVKTYNVTFVGDNPGSRTGVSMSVSNDTSKEVESQQVVIQLSDDTQSKGLVSEAYDIAAALLYTSTIGDTTKVYSSPYVFLTDSEVLSIKAGQICTFKFNESNVNKVVGVKIVATHGLEASAKCTSVQTYTTNDIGDVQLVDVYSSDETVRIDGDEYQISVTGSTANGSRTYKLATFKFKTMATPTIIDSKGNYPIRVIINYKDVNGLDRTEVVEDIRNIVTKSSSFLEGGVASFSRLLKGVSYIESMVIEPYNNTSIALAMWNLESIAFSVENTEMAQESTIGVGKTIYEGGSKLIKMSNSVMKLTISDGVETASFYNEDGSFTIGSESKIVITPEIIGNTYDATYKYTVYADLNGNGFIKNTTGSSMLSGDKINLKIGANTTDIIQKYKVAVTSEQFEELSYSVIINVTGEQTSDSEVEEEKTESKIIVDYTINDISGQIVNDSKAVEIESGTDSNAKIKAAIIDATNSKSITYAKYKDMGAGAGYEFVEQKTISSGTEFTDTIPYNASKTNDVKYRYIFTSPTNPDVKTILELTQAKLGEPEISLEYSWNGKTGVVKTGNTSTIIAGGNYLIETVVRGSNLVNDNIIYSWYKYDSEEADWVRLSENVMKPGTLSMFTPAVNTSNQDVTYKCVATSEKDSSVAATLIVTQKPISATLKYTINNDTGSISNGTKEIYIDSACTVNLSAVIDNASGGAKFLATVAEGSGSASTVSEKTVTSGETLSISIPANTSANGKTYTYVISAVDDSSKKSTLIVHQYGRGVNAMSITYTDGNQNVSVGSGETKEIVLSEDTALTITTNQCGALNNSAYKYSYYYDQGEGYKLYYEKQLNGSQSISYTKHKSLNKVDAHYKVVITSVEDPSKTATLIITTKGSSSGKWSATSNQNVVAIRILDDRTSGIDYIAINEEITAKISSTSRSFQYEFMTMDNFDSRYLSLKYYANNKNTIMTVKKSDFIQRQTCTLTFATLYGCESIINIK